MELSKQVVSLEIAKKLEEAGYPQDTVLVWSNHENGFQNDIEVRQRCYHTWDREDELYVICCAPIEYWVNIPRTKGLYQISNFGQVKRVDGGIIKPVIHNNYVRVCLCIDNTKRFISIHRIMAELFCPNPFNKKQVNHKNGIKIANWIDNLEWCSAKENTEHAFQTGLRIVRSRNKKGQFV